MRRTQSTANFILCAVAAGLVSACSRPAAEQAPVGPSAPRAHPVVAVTSYPLAYFAGRIAGTNVSIYFPAPGDVDPAFWQPADEMIAAYQQADLILVNGADFERWMKTATIPEARVVNTSQRFADAYLREPHVITHSHGPGGEHSHGGLDFNTWLDPEQAARQAETVRDALAALVPLAKAEMERGCASLLADLATVESDLAAVSRELGDRPLLASHPVYAYLARRYSWKLESVHWEPGDVQPEQEWTVFGELLKRHPGRVMIWEDYPLPVTAERLKSLGVQVVVFRTCGNRPPSGDYLSEMRANVARLRSALPR